MIKYFKDLLKTLKNIEKHLEKIGGCVKNNSRRYGSRKYINTGHWND